MIDTNSQSRNLRSDIVFVFVLGLACYIAWLIRDVLVLLYVSALFAVILAPVVQAVSKLHVGRWRPFKGVAVLVLPLAVVGVLMAFGFFALPPVVHDLQEFSKELPSRTPVLLERLRSIPFADHLDPDEINRRIQDSLSGAATQLLVSIKDWAGKLFAIITGFIRTSRICWRRLANLSKLGKLT